MKLPENDNCCGCMACVQACPQKCIEIVEDKKGFNYPQLISDQCLDCQICSKVCPYYATLDNEGIKENLLAYAAKSKNEILRKRSSSGGIFGVLADYILKHFGVVFGAIYDDNFQVIHSYIEDKNDLHKILKSKYVQSFIGNSYEITKQFLDNGRLVLFSGTPCQVAGLKKYLGKEYINLVALDVICHGVPSPGIWRKYLQEKQKEKGYKLSSVSFRNNVPEVLEKYKRRDNYLMHYSYENGEDEYIIAHQDAYFSGFLGDLYLRPVCFNCTYRNFVSGSDIQLGDYWGIETVFPEVEKPYGISAVILKTEKAKKLFVEVKDNLWLKETNIYDIEKGNPALHTSFKKHKNWNNFFNEVMLDEKSVKEVIWKNNPLNLFRWEKNEKYTFGVWGSYNLRASVCKLIELSQNELLYQFSNSSLVSIMSDMVCIPKDVSFPVNLFRKSMLENDFQKKFIIELDRYCKIDYLFLDFLEERFMVMPVENAFITISDAFMETNIQKFNLLKEEEHIEFWKKASLTLINLLKEKFDDKQVILCETYLSEYIKERDGSITYYDNRFDIIKINKRLAIMYEYFKTNYKNISVITIDKNLLYTQYNHRFGTRPEHLNELVYKICADSFYDIIQKNKA